METCHPQNEIYEKNVRIIKDRFPETYAKVVNQRSHAEICIQRLQKQGSGINVKIVSNAGKTCHLLQQQAIDQSNEFVKSGRTLTGTDTVVFVGMGIGCGILKLLELVEQAPRIIIFEYSLPLLRSVMHWVDLSPILAHPKVELFLGEDVDVGGIFKQRIFEIAAGQVRIVPVPEYYQFFGEPFVRFSNTVVEWIKTTHKIWQTMKIRGKMILANTIDNLPAIVSGLPLGQVRGIAEGLPAVCIAPGPSLDESFPELRNIGDGALLIACDSAVQGLLENGIRPHVVVTTDINEINYEKIRSVVDRLRDTVLVFGAGANPDNVRGFPSRKRIVVSAENAILDHWITPRFGVEYRIPALTSVIHAALFTAMAIGAQPIALVGVDLAFIGEKSHANGSVFKYKPENNRNVTTMGIDGSMLMSTSQMIADKNQIESVLARVPRQVVNTSKMGAIIKGTETGSLAAFIEGYVICDSPAIGCLESTDWRGAIKIDEIVSAISSLGEEIVAVTSKCNRQIRKVDQILNAGKKRKLKKKLNTRIGAAVSSYRQFEQQHAPLISLLNTLRLDSIQDTHRKESAVADTKKQTPLLTRVMAEMNMLKDTYQSLVTAGEYVKLRLEKPGTYFRHLSDLERDQALDQINQLHDCAAIHAQARQLYLAEKAYRKCIDSCVPDENAWAGLVSLYAAFKLWLPAQKTVQVALDQLPQSRVLQTAASDLSSQIIRLKTTAREMITDNKQRLAAVCLREYLSIHPDDHDAGRLYESLTS